MIQCLKYECIKYDVATCEISLIVLIYNYKCFTFFIKWLISSTRTW